MANPAGVAPATGTVFLYRGRVKHAAQIDALGAFTFLGLPAGLYRFYVDGRSLPEGFLPPWKQHVARAYGGRPTGVFGTSIRLTEGERRQVDMRVFDAAGVRGRVVGAAGAGISNALVSIQTPSGFSAVTRTGKHGRFSIERAYPGLYTSRVRLDSSPGSSPLPIHFELAGGELRELGDLTAGVGGHQLEGRVVDENERAVVGLPVVCRAEAQIDSIWRTWTNEEGRFELGRIPSTEVTVFVGWVEDRMSVVLPPAGKSTPSIRLDLRGAAATVDTGTTRVVRARPFRLKGRVLVDSTWLVDNELDPHSIHVKVQPVEGGALQRTSQAVQVLDLAAPDFSWACDTPHDSIEVTVTLRSRTGVEHERRFQVDPLPDEFQESLISFP